MKRTPLVPEYHKKTCPTYRASTCAIAIECKHGYDCCPICDKCTCADAKQEPA